MCGIAGIFSQKQTYKNVLEKILKDFNHRGPDDLKIFTDGNYLAGMVRLSINDLQNGSQPFISNNGNIIIFYNGEIYNFKNLKNKLLKKGYSFNSNCDGEVLANLFECYGKKSFSLIDGMYAISVWDKQKKQIIIARDLVGEKPLFYFSKNNTFIFSSQLSSFRKIQNLTLNLNYQGIFDLPTFLWIPEPSTIFREVKAVPVGSMITFRNGKVKTEKILNKDYANSINLNLEKNDLVDFTKKLVEDSVNLRLISDVKLGCFLSGGLDSSIITAIANETITNLETFSVSFENKSDPYSNSTLDESGLAKSFSEKKELSIFL